MKMIKVIGILSNYRNILGVGDDLLIRDIEDMRHFRDTTMNNIIVMGRKTIESLPRKLDGRFTICLTSNKEYVSDNADLICHSVNDVLNYVSLSATRTLYVCGGAEVYKAFSPFMNELIVTHFDLAFYEDYVSRKIEKRDDIVYIPEELTDMMRDFRIELVIKRLNTGIVYSYQNYPTRSSYERPTTY
jgi:dihydrofolate reductase